MKNLITKTKIMIVATASLFTLAATAGSINTSTTQQDAAYLVQGASNATMTSLVEQVGGEVIHNFSVIQAISAELNDAQVNQINEINPLVRFTNKDAEAANADETAGVIFGTRTKRTAGVIFGTRTKRVAGVIFGTRTKRTAGVIFGTRTKRTAGVIFGTRTKRTAGVIFGTRTKRVAGVIFGTRTKRVA